jgi:hypothetical protein
MMADASLIADVEKWFESDDDEASFARQLFGNAQVDALRRDLRNDMKRMGRDVSDDPHVKEYRGAEFATRLFDELAKWNERRLRELRSIILERVCPSYIQLKSSGSLDSEPLKIAIAVADALTSVAVCFPAPIPRAAVYIVRQHILDKWCDEPAIPQPQRAQIS